MVALIAIVGSMCGAPMLDPIAGLMVAGMVALTGVQVCLNTYGCRGLKDGCVGILLCKSSTKSPQSEYGSRGCRGGRMVMMVPDVGVLLLGTSSIRRAVLCVRYLVE